MKNLLVIRPGALGDVVLTLPAIRWLRSRHPGPKLCIVGYPAAWAIVAPLVDEIVSIDRSLFAGLFGGSPSPQLRDWMEEVATVVAWTSRDVRPALAALGIPAVQWASPYPPPSVHASRWLLESLGRTGEGESLNPGAEASPLVSATGEELAEAGSELRYLGINRPVFIHPGAGAKWKIWPADRFALVADQLAQAGYDVVLVEGPADARVVRDVQRHVARPLPVLARLAPRRLAAFLAHAQLFLGNDSGATHLAGAVGVPTIALFGPTDPVSWHPLGNSAVIRHCEKRTQEPGQIRVCQDVHCMKGITIEVVLKALNTLTGTRAATEVGAGPARL